MGGKVGQRILKKPCMEHHKRGHVKLYAVELRSEASCSVHAVCVFWLESAEARDEQYSHADLHKHRRQQQRDTFTCRRKFECRAEGSWTESVGWGTSKPLFTTLYRRRTTLAPARSPQAFLQVMSSQAQDAQAPVLEGETRGPLYGAVAPEAAARRAELPNGVPSRTQEEYVRQLPGGGRTEATGATVVPHQVQGTRVEIAESSPRTVDRPFLSPELSQGAVELASQARLPGVANPEPEMSRDSTRTLDLEVMYGAGDQGPAVVRWVARLTDFVRTTASTATGSGGFQERVMEGLGLTGTQGSSSPQQTLTSPPQQHSQQGRPQQQLMAAPQQMQQVSPQGTVTPAVRRNVVQALNFSPPEELPAPLRPPRQDAALFTGEQLQRLRTLELEAPALYGAPADHGSASTASSAVQAEVQRQLRDFMNQHRTEATTLRQQVEQLKKEKHDLQLLAEARISQQLPGGDQRGFSQQLPGGDQRGFSQQLPGGDQRGQQQVPGGDQRGPQQLPGGDQRGFSQQLPGGDQRGRQQLPGGDQRGFSQQLPGGDQHGFSQQLPGGDQRGFSQQLPGGDQRGFSQQLPGGDQHGSSQQQLPGGDQHGSSQQQLPGGDQQQQLPGGDLGIQAMGGQQDQGRGNSKSDDEAYDSRPGSPPQPTPMELLGVIATGMRQLQEVQLGQMEKKDTPEVVKPGISSLPMLESPGKETSPVDIQDWLEEVGSIMGDLSDTSNEWWKAVREMADTHYKRWVTATPMEKLALALPKDAKLEYGKYGRVNSRAAGMILGALPAEVKSEMVTKKCTGSSTSLVFKLLTTYRPGGEQEKTQLLEQLTTPEGATSPDLAVQALRRWGRWFSRAQDLAVTVPDPVLMVKGLASIVNPVLSKNQDVWLRTTMMRNRLQLDSNPTEATTLDYHRHLQAEMELLSTASSTTGRAPPRLKSATAATEPPSATPASTSQSSRRRTSRAGGLRKATKAARREWSALFNTTETPLEWDTRRRTAPPRSQPTKKSADGPQATSSPNSAKGKGKGDKGAQASTATSGATPATRAVSTATPTKDQPQPGPEPSPTSSPASAAKEPPGDIQQILTDAHQMLRTMLATTAPSATSTTTGAPTYESIQRQLDEMRLKAMKVKEVVVAEDTFRGALLDSGATHVLRPAKDENEHLQSKEVPVVLAGDERRLLRQTPGGSIILNPTTGEEAQTILVLGRLVSYLGCSLKWTRGGLQLKHPKYGTIHTRIRAGCPEITNTVQAAALIAELESRKVEELREKTAELQDRLNAIRMMEVTKGDWRHDLAAYAQEGCVVDGLQTLYKSPMFKDLPEDVLMGMVPNVDVNDKAGWEYLKALPVNRRVSRAWVVNLYGGRKLKEDPVQMLNNKISPDTNTEVVVVNAEILLDGGWDVKGPAYKALMWGAMTSRIKGVIGSPPAKTYAGQRPLRTLEEPYGITGLNPTEAYRTNKETALAARQFLLYLVAHACSKDKFVAWMMKNPDVEVGASAPKDGISLWQTPMAKEFMEITAPLGTTTTQWTLSEDGEKVSKVTVHDNLNLKALVGDDESGPLQESRLRRAVLSSLQGLAVASTLNWKANTELQKLSVEQDGAYMFSETMFLLERIVSTVS